MKFPARIDIRSWAIRPWMALAVLVVGPAQVSVSLAGSHAGSHAGATPQEEVPADFDFDALLERDKGVSFPPRAGQAALDVLRAEGLGPAMRAAAMATLGETSTSSGRKLIEPWLKKGSSLERCAAILSWGQMGSFTDGEDPFLVDLLGDSDLEVAGCALYALYMDTPKPVMKRIAFLVARPDEPLFRAANHLLKWHEDGTLNGPGPVAKRLELRWRAARSFGALDGQLWSAHLVEQLAEDVTFVDQVILPAAGALLIPQVKDHLLGLVTREPSAIGPAVAGVICMPGEMDRLVQSGLWVPQGDEQSFAILEASESRGLARFIPNILARMAVNPNFTLRVSGWLSSLEPRYQDVIDENLSAKDPKLRAVAARAAGQANLAEWVLRLRDLSRDPNPSVRLEALVARVRSGDDTARGPLMGYFTVDRDQVSQGVRDGALRLMRIAYNARVLDLLEDIQGALQPGYERALVSSILLQGGRASASDSIRANLGQGITADFWNLQMIHALGESPLAVDRTFLESVFPQQGAQVVNVALAQALIAQGSEAVVPVLRHAVWNRDVHRSLLAGAVLANHYGKLRLMQWLERPPLEANEQDLRRVGYILGTLGGIESVDTLTRHLGSAAGVDRPEVQGALLGALGARTY